MFPNRTLFAFTEIMNIWNSDKNLSAETFEGRINIYALLLKHLVPDFHSLLDEADALQSRGEKPEAFALLNILIPKSFVELNIRLPLLFGAYIRLFLGLIDGQKRAVSTRFALMDMYPTDTPTSTFLGKSFQKVYGYNRNLSGGTANIQLNAANKSFFTRLAAKVPGTLYSFDSDDGAITKHMAKCWRDHSEGIANDNADLETNTFSFVAVKLVDHLITRYGHELECLVDLKEGEVEGLPLGIHEKPITPFTAHIRKLFWEGYAEIQANKLVAADHSTRLIEELRSVVSKYFDSRNKKVYTDMRPNQKKGDDTPPTALYRSHQQTMESFARRKKEARSQIFRGLYHGPPLVKSQT